MNMIDLRTGIPHWRSSGGLMTQTKSSNFKFRPEDGNYRRLAGKRILAYDGVSRHLAGKVLSTMAVGYP